MTKWAYKEKDDKSIVLAIASCCWGAAETEQSYIDEGFTVTDDYATISDKYDVKWIGTNIDKLLEQNTFTKLQIRRAMRSMGNEVVLDALIASDETFARDWADAIEIDLADEITAQALAASSIDVTAVKKQILEIA